MSGYDLSDWTVNESPHFAIHDCMNKVWFLMIMFLLPADLKLSLTVFKVLRSFLAALSDPVLLVWGHQGLTFTDLWYKNRTCFYILVLCGHGNIYCNDHQSCVIQSWIFIEPVLFPLITSHICLQLVCVWIVKCYFNLTPNKLQLTNWLDWFDEGKRGLKYCTSFTKNNVCL